MSKELPYFRFTPQEWQNGKISLENYQLKGLFVDICSYYWVNDCSIAIALLKKRFSNDIALIDELIDNDIFYIDEESEFVVISFLNEQYDLLSETRKRRQIAGSKGGKNKSSNAKAMLKQSSSYKDKDKDNIKKDKDNNIIENPFETFRKLYPGTKRGLETELANFKKHKDWLNNYSKLLPALQNEIEYKQKLKDSGKFVAEWKNLQTWINKRCWEQEFEEVKQENNYDNGNNRGKGEELFVSSSEKYKTTTFS